MTRRQTATLTLLMALATLASGCMKINYAEWIEAAPARQALETIKGPIALDHQASYLEVSSDGGKDNTPGARYERGEILAALEARFNAAASAGEPKQARALLIASLDHVAGDTAGAVLHSIFGVTLLLGLPYSCAYSDVKLVLQSAKGATLFARGRGSACGGLYYPRDYKMAALADGIDDAMKKLAPVQEDKLNAQVPRLSEIPSISRGSGQALLNDRVVWWAQPTRSFPRMWGESAGQ